MLSALGISSRQETLYRKLLYDPDTPTDELARYSGMRTEEVRPEISQLQSLGLLSWTADGSIDIMPPDAAIDALLRERESELGRVRTNVSSLMEDYDRGRLSRNPEELVQVVSGQDQIFRRIEEIRRFTKQQIMLFDKPPYVAPKQFDEVENSAPLLHRGIEIYVIYSHDSFAASPWPERSHHIQQLAAEGEHGRVLPELPNKMMISDKQLALVPLTSDDHVTDKTLLVRDSGLLKALIALFNSLWVSATPILHPHDFVDVEDTVLGDDDRKVLSLLALGLPDDAISRELGISRRTLGRRIARISEGLNAASRFQMGMHMQRTGALPERHLTQLRDSSGPTSAS